ncbi:hypothetical protein DBR32_00830 [Taibaiella sp. KBW10]|uniref:DCC1-like thiol-disulfide oxidoreductase family protein n=1 Tax=Taibaiella sp. KBW10 TaxID=2153357 RepID=UPI000F590A84|nr:DCC1-like thiol-disulfide oxidoreductase family protein [Taibaiella sp. KBW10]RQO32191.1 hypothetical protein DBR32_00830 [Taibaiella sp. KBW10]
MKTLQHHTLIYDKDCPMCTLYSQAFISCGMLDAQGRKPYAAIKEDSYCGLDRNRARNEIALVNTQNNQVLYGLDSLLLIIGNRFPLLAKMARIAPLYWLFNKCYAFISYNRKQIMPSRIKENEIACTPDFNLRYRISYILFVMLFSSIILSLYSPKLGNFLPQQAHFTRELLICTGQIAWQTLWLKRRLGKEYWDYIGNMMTVSLIGTLLLLPLLFIQTSALFSLAYFLVVAGIMLAEHYRRMTLLNLGILPSISWVAFRLVALGIIFLIG